MIRLFVLTVAGRSLDPSGSSVRGWQVNLLASRLPANGRQLPFPAFLGTTLPAACTLTRLSAGNGMDLSMLQDDSARRWNGTTHEAIGDAGNGESGSRITIAQGASLNGGLTDGWGGVCLDLAGEPFAGEERPNGVFPNSGHRDINAGNSGSDAGMLGSPYGVSVAMNAVYQYQQSYERRGQPRAMQHGERAH